MNQWSSLMAVLFSVTLYGCDARQPQGVSEHVPPELLGMGSAIDRVDAPSQHQVGVIADGDGSSVAPVDPEWPALFGPNRTSVSETRVDAIWPEHGPQLVWEAESGTGYGSPVTADHRVVFGYRKEGKEFIQCRNVDTGDLIWEKKFATEVVCDFEYSDGPYSTPTIDVVSRRVFDVGGGGRFTCLDFDSGQVIWSRNLHKEYGMEPDIFPVGATPILDCPHDEERDAKLMGQLIFNLGAVKSNAGILALSVEDGHTIWEATDHGPSYATPMIAEIHGMRFVFVLTDEGLVSLNPDDGSVDWLYEFRRKGDLVRNATSPMVFGNKVLAVSSGLGAVCLEITPQRNYQMLWRNRRSIDSQYNTVVLGDRHVYSFTSSRQGGAEFRCIDLQTGKVAWKYASLLNRGMALAAQDSIILLGEHGHLAALEFTPHQAHELSFSSEPLMTAPCYCSPAIYGTKLVLKDEKRIAVYDLSGSL